jgi:uncharacterized protein YcbX
VRATVSRLWRHPIKGHGVEPVLATTLAPGRTMPWDRVWAIAQEGAKLGDGASWVPCVNFGRGAKSPALMAVRARTDEAAGTVTLTHPAREPLTVDPDRPADAGRLIAWVAPLWNPDRPGPAQVVRAAVGMTDSAFPSIAVLNRASLAALGERLGMELAMERFRGNIWLDGLEPWHEFELVGREIRVGEARLLVREIITRCKATTVDPDTGVPDADTLGALSAGWGHQDFGVYAEVVEGGRVAVGDTLAA